MEAAIKLLNGWRETEPRAPVRLLGVAARDLSSVPQLELFASPDRERDRHLDATIDGIRAKFGNAAVSRGSVLRTKLTK
jgi:DNA polymerase-4